MDKYETDCQYNTTSYGVIGGESVLTDCVKNNGSFLKMTRDKSYNYAISDNLSFFRCLLVHEQYIRYGLHQRFSYHLELKKCFKLARKFYGKNVNIKTYKGVTFNNLPA